MAMPMSPEEEKLQWARLELEREKWNLEAELRRRDQQNRDAEIALKQSDQLRSRWTNPLVVAILAAALAGASNALVAAVNSYFQRDLEERRSKAQLDLEERKSDGQISLEKSKAESGRILEMIKTGDPAKASNNLRFLIESGLVADKDLTEKVAGFLAKGQAPSLPPPNARFEFEPSSALTATVQAGLQQKLNEFADHLDRLGFGKGRGRVAIRVSDDGSVNAYYQPSGNVIVIHSRLAGDQHVALREYTHHHLLTDPNLLERPDADELLTIESGLADYLTCSFFGEPRLGPLAAAEFKVGRPFLRNMDNQRSFAELAKVRPEQKRYEGAEIWGGAFWEMRARLGQEMVDPLVVRAWFSMLKAAATVRPETFIRMLLREGEAVSADNARMMQQILQKRGFPSG
jgi:hypothetical protein